MSDYSSIFSRWNDLKIGELDRRKHSLIDVFVNHIKFKTKLIQESTTLNKNVNDKIKAIKEKAKAKNFETSVDFNVLDYFSINEPMHSFLLADLLKSESFHGQDNRFLHIFLAFLNIQDYQKGKWLVTAEKNNVDILIERKSENNSIIIENKSNNATDQPNQLYRYWYYNVFLNNKRLFPKNNLPLTLPDNFRIIYLVPNDNKKPSEDTLTKPKELEDEDAPDKLSREWITIWTFRQHIGRIIIQAIGLLQPNNHRLREYLQQYLETITHLN